MKEDRYLSTSSPFLLFATMSKRNDFSSGLSHKLQKAINRKKKWWDLRPGVIASDERFDELLVLHRYGDVVILHKIIEHDFRPVLMLPFLAFPFPGKRKCEK